MKTEQQRGWKTMADGNIWFISTPYSYHVASPGEDGDYNLYVWQDGPDSALGRKAVQITAIELDALKSLVDKGLWPLDIFAENKCIWKERQETMDPRK